MLLQYSTLCIPKRGLTYIVIKILNQGLLPKMAVVSSDKQFRCRSVTPYDFCYNSVMINNFQKIGSVKNSEYRRIEKYFDSMVVQQVMRHC